MTQGDRVELAALAAKVDELVARQEATASAMLLLATRAGAILAELQALRAGGLRALVRPRR